MLFHVEINNPVIIQAASIVAHYYNDYKFLEKLRTIDRFNYTTDSGRDVAEKLKNATITVIIREWKPMWRWTKQTGHAEFNKELNTGIVYLNTYKLNRPLFDLVETFLHEPLHMLGYAHKGNTNNEFNRGTVPYKVSSMFAEYTKGKIS
jgi:hypothetical protein